MTAKLVLSYPFIIICSTGIDAFYVMLAMIWRWHWCSKAASTWTKINRGKSQQTLFDPSMDQKCQNVKLEIIFKCRFFFFLASHFCQPLWLPSMLPLISFLPPESQNSPITAFSQARHPHALRRPSSRAAIFFPPAVDRPCVGAAEADRVVRGQRARDLADKTGDQAHLTKLDGRRAPDTPH